MTLDVYKYAAGEAKPGKAQRDNKREKRLERNRESARKCRKKRKAFVGDLQSQCESYADENAMLLLENQRLLDIINKLQGGNAPAMTMGDVPESAPKRRKSEKGDLMANDFSESAAGLPQAGHLDHLSALFPDGDSTGLKSHAVGELVSSPGSSPSLSAHASDDLASLMPFADLVGEPRIKLEEDAALSDEFFGNRASLAIPVMDKTNSDAACSDLASTFANNHVDPEQVSFDDLIEL